MKSLMKEVLEEIADHYLETDIADDSWVTPSYYIDYSDKEVMAAVIIFSSILWNRTNKSEKANAENAGNFWKELHKLVKKYTGVNTRTFYK